jgi:hypothetical protein
MYRGSKHAPIQVFWEAAGDDVKLQSELLQDFDTSWGLRRQNDAAAREFREHVQQHRPKAQRVVAAVNKPDDPAAV